MLRPSPKHGTLRLSNDDDDQSKCAVTVQRIFGSARAHTADLNRACCVDWLNALRITCQEPDTLTNQRNYSRSQRTCHHQGNE